MADPQRVCHFSWSGVASPGDPGPMTGALTPGCHLPRCEPESTNFDVVSGRVRLFRSFEADTKVDLIRLGRR